MKKKATADNPLLFYMGFIVLVIFVVCIKNLVGQNIVIGHGVRAALIIKLSNKGVIWPSWEGEATIYQQGYINNQVWSFSIDRYNPHQEKLSKQLQYALDNGAPIKIRYEEVLGITPWHADTRYRVVEIIF